MIRCLSLATLALAIGVAPVSAAGISGKYIESRTCDVWTAPCFANAEMNLGGKHALMGWKVDDGSVGGVQLDGLSIVAVVAASDTLGLKQTGTSRTILIVDEKATPSQRDALIRLAHSEGGDLLRNVVKVESAPIELVSCECKGGSCARLQAGKVAHIETRCIDKTHDKACGNESAFYPPLARNTKVRAALAVEHGFTGTGFNTTWKEAERRGAYVGSFEIH